MYLKIDFFKFNILGYISMANAMGIGDWGLGQSPIPNPQSPSFILIENLKNEF